jgi:uncharacterized protein YjbI with pentapeptide repeats
LQAKSTEKGAREMTDFTPSAICEKAQRGEPIERADLKGVVLVGAMLEGVSFRRSDLDGANLEKAKLARANLKSASLREAFLADADLRDANLDNADLEGANLSRANLSGANLTRANLEGANLEKADLRKAKLSYAQLESANLAGALLSGAVLAHVAMGECHLGGAKLDTADLTGANLRAANLEDADFTDARLDDAVLTVVSGHGACFAGASLRRTNLGASTFEGGDFTMTDLRGASLTGATLDGATFTGAKVRGLFGLRSRPVGVRADWLDTSVDGDGSERSPGTVLPELLMLQESRPVVVRSPKSRYFGRGDVLKDAVLEFEDGATVEIESRFERCSIALGQGTELVVGHGGVLAGCQIRGAGNIRIDGQFVERESPGIIGASQLVVSSTGSLIGAVEQPREAWTKFAFEPGCKLRLQILNAKQLNEGRPS